MKDNGYASLGVFVAGVLIGGGVALLLASQRGKDLREELQTCASRAKDDLAERGKDAWNATAGQGKEYLESGRAAMKDREKRGGLAGSWTGGRRHTARKREKRHIAEGDLKRQRPQNSTARYPSRFVCPAARDRCLTALFRPVPIIPA